MSWWSSIGIAAGVLKDVRIDEWTKSIKGQLPGLEIGSAAFNLLATNIRCSVSPIPLATTSYNSEEEEEPAEDIQEPEEQVATDVDKPGPNSNEMESDANEMENTQ